MFKRIVAFVIATVILFGCAFSCFAIEYDGVPHNDEWLGSAIYSFESPEGFNNDVTFAYMRVIPKTESNQLYLCVSMRVNDISAPENSAVILSLNDGEEIYLKGTCDSPYNQNLYNVEYGMAYDEGSENITYEILLGIKHGIPESNKLIVRLCDCHASASNEFGFMLEDIAEMPDDKQEPEETTEKTDKTKVTKTTRKKSPSKTKEDDFTFKKAENSSQPQQNSQHDEAQTTSTADLTARVTDNASVKKKVLTATGIICAVAIAGSAVYNGIRKTGEKRRDSE